MFDSVIYVYYDRKSKKLVDSFIADNKDVAMRFVAMRVSDAVRNNNFGLLTIWGDCELYEIDLRKENITKDLLCDLGTIIPKKEVKNETN